MSKQFRRTNEKYIHGSHNIREAIRISCPKVFAILEQMENYLKEEENIWLYHWTEDKFYIEVIDRSIEVSILRCRMGISFDFKRDIVLFSNDGGNCFVRANKWKSWLTKRLPSKILTGEYNDKTFHVYKDERETP